MSIDTSRPLCSNLGQVRNSIIAVDSRKLERGCMARVLRGEFSDHDIFEADSTAVLASSSFGCPCLVILRIQPDRHSDETTARDIDAIRQLWPNAHIALLCDDDERSLQYALRHKCSGYFPTSMPLEIAVAALRLVLVGGLYFPQSFLATEPVAPVPSAVASSLAREPVRSEGPPNIESEIIAPAIVAPCNGTPIVAPRSEPAGSPPSFTPREIEVIDALRRGRSNKVIADDLKLSENTVKVHVRHIMRKLRATNRTQAALRSQLLFSEVRSIN